MGAMAGAADQDLAGIVESAARGDEIAFARIVAAFHEQVYSICMMVCRDRPMAEEAVQSTWSQVWQKLDSVRRLDRLRPWVVSIAINEAKQALRNNRLKVYTTEGEHLATWGGDYSSDLYVDKPVGVAVAEDGSVYFTQYNERSLEKLSVEEVPVVAG